MKGRKVFKNKNAQKIPTRCLFCGIGIGVSTYVESGQTKVFKHECTEPYIVQIEGKEAALCNNCRLSRSFAKDKERYLKKKSFYEKN